MLQLLAFVMQFSFFNFISYQYPGLLRISIACYLGPRSRMTRLTSLTHIKSPPSTNTHWYGHFLDDSSSYFGRQFYSYYHTHSKTQSPQLYLPWSLLRLTDQIRSTTFSGFQPFFVINLTARKYHPARIIASFQFLSADIRIPFAANLLGLNRSALSKAKWKPTSNRCICWSLNLDRWSIQDRCLPGSQGFPFLNYWAGLVLRRGQTLVIVTRIGMPGLKSCEAGPWRNSIFPHCVQSVLLKRADNKEGKNLPKS